MNKRINVLKEIHLSENLQSVDTFKSFKSETSKNNCPVVFSSNRQFEIVENQSINFYYPALSFTNNNVVEHQSMDLVQIQKQMTNANFSVNIVSIYSLDSINQVNCKLSKR